MTYNELKTRFKELFNRRGRGSIKARDILTLIMELIDKIMGIDVSATATIRKSYETLEQANADLNPIDPETNKPMKVGQLISVTTDPDINNNAVYRLASLALTGEPTWERQAHLGDMSIYMKSSDYSNEFVIDGLIRKSDGSFGSSTSLKTTPFIAIPQGQFIKVGGYDGGIRYPRYRIVLFYDINKNYISAYETNAQSEGFLEVSISPSEIPENAKFFRALSSNSLASKSYIKFVKTASIHDAISELYDETQKIDTVKKQISTDDFSKVLGGVRSDGTFFKHTTIERIEHIPVVAGELFEYFGETISGGYAVNYYNNGTFVGHCEEIQVNRVQKVVFTIPNGVTTMSVQGHISEIAALRLIKLLSYEAIEKRLQNVESDVSSLENITSNITGDLVIDGYATDSSNGRIAYIGDIGYTDAAATNDYIEVSAGEIIYYSGEGGSQIGIAGYDANKVYTTRIADISTLSLFQLVGVEVDKPITIPDGVAYIRACTRSNITAPLALKRSKRTTEKIIDLDKEVKNIKGSLERMPSIIVCKVSDTNFQVKVLQRSIGKYITHNFIKAYYETESPYGDGLTKTVVGSDIWYPDRVIVDGKTIMQGNYNFIYFINSSIAGFENEGGHVGAGHGCVTADWIKFFADGVEIDPTTLTVDIECEVFRSVYKAKCLAINKLVSPDGAHGVPKLTDTGELIVTAIHHLDASIRVNNVLEHRNRLVIQRDGVQFRQCHGGMLSCYRPIVS